MQNDCSLYFMERVSCWSLEWRTLKLILIDQPFRSSEPLVPSARSFPSHSEFCILHFSAAFVDWCPTEETNTTYKVSETKGLERLTTKRITFIGKALLLPFYQTTITKQHNKNNQMILLCKNTGNTCCSISSCFFFSVSTAMLNSLASLKEKSGQ